jgi:methylenetetrahydrofolate dehydrogenase (NADP+)/methenyltetrahydrofolate cyclohydrolase
MACPTAVVIGRSNQFGKRVGLLLLPALSQLDRACQDSRPRRTSRRADILVVAVSQPLAVKSDWINPGAPSIDVGISRQASVVPKTKLDR